MEQRANPDFRFLATGIGSVPFLDIGGTCRLILEKFPEIPYWPQFVRRTHLEDMIVQFSEGLPLLAVEGRSLVFPQHGMEKELVSFYERYLADDFESFAVSRDYAPGLYELTHLLRRRSAREALYIKGHTVGPITFAAAVKDREGRTLFYYPDLADACTKGIAIKALWQVKKLSATGRKVIVFLDEPFLTGFGSAFTPVRREDVVQMLGEVIDYLRQRSDALVGIHCCGNTEWPVIVEAGPDVISFDAFSHMEHFLLFPEAISRFIRRGGIVAWGMVPTFGYTGTETVEGIYGMLRDGFSRLVRFGLDPEEIARKSILTPACGMGTMEPAGATGVLEMLPLLSRKCRENRW